MTVTSGFFPSVSDDRVYSADDFGAIFNGVIEDGVFKSIGNALDVSDNASMIVTVGSGRCWFFNCWLLNDSDLDLTVTASHATLNRKDIVVVEIDKTSTVRLGSIKIIDGTPAASPTAPTPVDTSLKKQYVLAEIYVGAAVSAINAGDITNKIGEAGGAPYASGVIETSLIGTFGTQYKMSHNLIKNYPSLEAADGVAPQWWSAVNATITEEDATGESLSGNQPNERILKVVTSAALGGIRQSFSPSDERLLKASGTIVSAGVRVYSKNSGTVTLWLKDSVTGTINNVSTILTNQWVDLVLPSESIGANNLYFEVTHSVNSATFYIANPILNTGDYVGHWEPRGLRPKVGGSVIASAVDPGAAWTLADATGQTSNLTVAIQLLVIYQNSTTAGASLGVRRYGSSISTYPVTAQLTSQPIRNHFTLIVDDQQRFEFIGGAVGDTESVTLVVGGVYWEWE